MNKGKRFVSILLAGALSLGICLQAQAATISETKEKGQELKSQKQQAEEEKASLSSKLNTIVADMKETEGKMKDKEAEIEAAEEDLIAAQIDENNQYESMKKRIKYLYENGDSQIIEVILTADSIADFLNKAEYVSEISRYDRDMLHKFQELVKEVEEKEKALEQEYKELEELQDDLLEKQAEVEDLLESANAKISDLEDQIGDNAKALEKLIKQAEDADRKQQEAASMGDGSSSGNSGTPGDSHVSGNGQITHPVPGYSRISSYFGYREQPLAGASTNHKGIDFAAPTGTPIYAAAGGTVVSSGYSGNAGKIVVINHGNGMVTKYMHCNTLFVRSGQKVSKGQNIAQVGSTGNSTGPHLHFQLEIGGVPKNPLKYL